MFTDRLFRVSSLCRYARRAILPIITVAGVRSVVGLAAEPAEAVGLTCNEFRVTADAVMRHVTFLASDSLRGRATPSPGLEAAASYVASQFRSFGLESPAGTGELVSPWEYSTVSFVDDSVRVAVSGSRGTFAPRFGRDFFMLRGPRTAFDGSLVFAADAADTANYPARARGRVLFAPLRATGTEQVLGIAHDAMHAARRVGALGLILMLDSSVTQTDIEQLTASGRTMDHTDDGVTVVGVLHRAGAGILELAGMDETALRERRADPVPVTVRVALPLRVDRYAVPNVVAMLPGRDARLRSEYVVVSAHMDHLGVGKPDATGDSIYNGADDNASGVAVLLEVARVLRQRPSGAARSLIFLATGAEEKGMEGSRAFVAQPPVPRSQIVADINIDMVGRAWQRDTVSVVGRDYSDLGATADRANSSVRCLRLTIVSDQWPKEHSFIRSDQISFARVGIPSIFFSTSGLHSDYHQPSDEVSGIDAAWVARVSSLVAATVFEVANAANRPAWDSASYGRIVTGNR